MPVNASTHEEPDRVGSDTESASSEVEQNVHVSEDIHPAVDPQPQPEHTCQCSTLKKKVVSLQKKLSWYRRTKSMMQKGANVSLQQIV